MRPDQLTHRLLQNPFVIPWALCCLFVLVLSFSPRSASPVASKINVICPSARSKNSAGCEAFVDIIDSAARGEHPPQLTDAQLLWIASVVRALPDPASMLIFGVGFDSQHWIKINCGGRTVFLEQSQEWIDKIKSYLTTDAEIYHTEYRGLLSKATDFFAHPWLLKVPETVSNACFNVYLVDGPAGGKTAPWSSENPGRMEAAYYSIKTARECIINKDLDEAHIFLHDVNRPVEQAIIKNYFCNSYFKGIDIEPLGTMGGMFGTLAGFKITRAVVAN